MQNIIIITINLLIGLRSMYLMFISRYLLLIQIYSNQNLNIIKL